MTGPRPLGIQCVNMTQTEINSEENWGEFMCLPLSLASCVCVYVCVLYIPALTVVQREPPIVCVNTAGSASVKSLKGGKKKKKNS